MNDKESVLDEMLRNAFGERSAEQHIRGLTDAYIRAVHDVGAVTLSTVGCVEMDCDDCGALASFIVIAPVDKFIDVLKGTLESDEFREQMKEKVLKGRMYNERRGLKKRSRKDKNESGNERFDFKVD